MNGTLLFWIYLINAIILINHEIDSAYWQEWKLFNLKAISGINAFLILHFPMILLILLGLILVYEQILAGLIISFILGASGLFAFFFHFYHLRKGHPGFNTRLSKAMIIATFVVSIPQLILTTVSLIR